MLFFIGFAIGAVAMFIAFVAVMAPKHWDMYHENLSLTDQLERVTTDRDHYKNLIRPNEWGAAAQHEARIVPKITPWVEEPPQGVIEFTFDDIKDGGER